TVPASSSRGIPTLLSCDSSRELSRETRVSPCVHRPAGGPSPVSFQGMARLLLLTNALAPSAEVLPALGLLTHPVRIIPAEPTALVDAPPCDAVLLDARRDLAVARSLCRVLRATGMSVPLLAILTEGGLAGITAEWGVDEVLLESAGPAE